VTDEDDIDDASMKSMRAVWLSMRDEEPPAAGMSALLAAARDKAEQMREQPSWWQRLFTQLRRPPALAFATVLLLIGGAVLVTRGTDEQVESLSKSDGAAPAPAVEYRSREAEMQTQADAAATPAVEPVSPVEQAAPVDHAEPPAPQIATKPKDVVAPKRKPQPRPGAGEDVGKNEPDRNTPFERDDAKTELKSGFGKGDTQVLESPGGVTTQKAPEAPPPEPRPEPTKEVQAPVTVTDSNKSTTPPNEQLARQAESAASRNDCPAVRAIVGRLRKQDESFYKTRLGKNVAVTKCL
jgi:hypothetical protein